MKNNVKIKLILIKTILLHLDMNHVIKEECLFDNLPTLL